MLKEEFQFYLDNQNELLKQYKGKFVVIVGNNVVGAYRTFKDAVIRSAKNTHWVHSSYSNAQRVMRLIPTITITLT